MGCPESCKMFAQYLRDYLAACKWHFFWVSDKPYNEIFSLYSVPTMSKTLYFLLYIYYHSCYHVGWNSDYLLLCKKPTQTYWHKNSNHCIMVVDSRIRELDRGFRIHMACLLHKSRLSNEETLMAGSEWNT